MTSSDGSNATAICGGAGRAKPNPPGTFASPFARLSFVEKADVFRIMDATDGLQLNTDPTPGRERDMHSTCGTFSAFPLSLPSSADGEQPFSQRSSSSWRTLSRDRRRIRAQDANHVRVLTQNMYFGTNFTALNSAAPAQAVSCGRRPRSAGGHWSYKLDQAGLSPSLPSRPR